MARIRKAVMCHWHRHEEAVTRCSWCRQPMCGNHPGVGRPSDGPLRLDFCDPDIDGRRRANLMRLVKTCAEARSDVGA